MDGLKMSRWFVEPDFGDCCSSWKGEGGAGLIAHSDKTPSPSSAVTSPCHENLSMILLVSIIIVGKNGYYCRRWKRSWRWWQMQIRPPSIPSQRSSARDCLTLEIKHIPLLLYSLHQSPVGHNRSKEKHTPSPWSCKYKCFILSPRLHGSAVENGIHGSQAMAM